jgi:hypothetical protein
MLLKPTEEIRAFQIKAKIDPRSITAEDGKIVSQQILDLVKVAMIEAEN